MAPDLDTLECPQCGNVGFFLHNGYYYCNTCGAQHPDFVDSALDSSHFGFYDNYNNYTQNEEEQNGEEEEQNDDEEEQNDDDEEEQYHEEEQQDSNDVSGIEDEDSEDDED